ELEAASSLLGPKRILAVDDSPTYLAELAGELRQEGYDVACAASGEEALELLAAQSVDAILMDLVMPGLSGKEACQRIKGRQEWRDIPLVILTARSESEGMLEGINAGADDYITKGPDFDVLKARLKAQLRRRQFEDENRLFREQLLRREMEALELRAVKELAEGRAAHIAELEAKNTELLRAEAEARALAGELESFSYSVSHDLRAPLRSIDGFSRALQEDCAAQLDEQGLRHLDRVCAAVARMERLIDDMLGLAQVSRRPLVMAQVDLSALAGEVAAELSARAGGRLRFDIQPGLRVTGDRGLLRILLENLMGNAVKFSSKRPEPRIELFGESRPDFGGTAAVAVRDNGVGFDMAYVNKLFGAFQRLHAAGDFPGTGIGLATAQRVVHRHGGRIWAEGRQYEGATFHFAW
ncbi:MAG TPA: response regulator, partial [bacterium]|nr:response regulator [bacterium]